MKAENENNPGNRYSLGVAGGFAAILKANLEAEKKKAEGGGSSPAPAYKAAATTPTNSNDKRVAEVSLSCTVMSLMFA